MCWVLSLLVFAFGGYAIFSPTFVCGSTILRKPLLDEAIETTTKATSQTSLSGHCQTNFIARAVIPNFIARTVIANFIAAVASRR